MKLIELRNIGKSLMINWLNDRVEEAVRDETQGPRWWLRKRAPHKRLGYVTARKKKKCSGAVK